MQSPVDSDGTKDLVRVDIIRPKETNSGLKVRVIMHGTGATVAVDLAGTSVSLPMVTGW